MRGSICYGLMPLQRLLCSALGAAAFFAAPLVVDVARAATAEWAQLPGRERIEISLDKGEGSVGEVTRNGRTSVHVDLSGGAGSMNLAPTAQAYLFKGAIGDSTGLTIHLSTPAFGYMVQKIDKQNLYVDVFSDPTGERWKGGPEPNADQTPAQPLTPAAETPAPPTQLVAPAQPSASAQMQPTQTQPAQAQPTQPQPAAVQPAQLQPIQTQPLPAQSAGPVQLQTQPIPQPQVQAQAAASQQNTSAQALLQPTGQIQQGPVQQQTLQPVQPVQQYQPQPVQTQQYQPVQAQQQYQPQQYQQPPQLQPLQPQPAGQIQQGLQPVQPMQQYQPQPVQAQPQQYQPVEAQQQVQAVQAQPQQFQPVQPQQMQQQAQPRPGNFAPSSGPVVLSNPDNAPVAPVSPQASSVVAAPQTSGVVAQPQVVPQGPTGGATQTPTQPQAAAPAQNSQASPAAVAPGKGAATSAAPTAHGAAPASAGEGAPKKIYVDEKGNPVPPPPEPSEVLEQVEASLGEGKFDDALNLLESILRGASMTKAQKEQALHRKADITYVKYKDDPTPHYTDIVNTTTDAINYNLESPRNADAYLRLGYVNLKAGNNYEAAAYFDLLRRKFPNDQGVPLSYFYEGDYAFEQGKFQDAADKYRYVVDHYPDSAYTRDAALGLVKTEYTMGYNDRAYTDMVYVERRWKDYYLTYPAVLTIMGDVSYRVGELDKARLSYWTYYNINPDGKDIDVVLTRLGDIYAAQKQKKAAMSVYEKVQKEFPDTDAGLVAKMRMAEEGVHDAPDFSEMALVFERPYSISPVQVYSEIITKHPNSPLAPIARLKLAMWNLWESRFPEALEQCNAIITSKADPVLVSRAKEVGAKAFTLMTAKNVLDQRYGQIQEMWAKYPFLQEQVESLAPESRIGLAVSFANQQRQGDVLNTVEPLLLGTKVPQYSEMALGLALGVYLENENWKQIEELYNKVELWELTPDMQLQLDYARGLAFENQNKDDLALPIWEKWYDSPALSTSQRAYMSYFLAQNAARSNQLEKAWELGQNALSQLLAMGEENPKKADPEKIKTTLGTLMNVAESAGRYGPALEYAEQYSTYLAPDSSEYLAVEYRKAGFNKKQGNEGEWRKILGDISAKAPNSLYGKIAKSELNAAGLRNKAAGFSSNGNL